MSSAPNPVPALIPIRRALISVSDKRGVVALAQRLVDHGCELVSTGGTRAVLEEAGLPVTDITKVSGNPEAFGGRMKTISFAVESALLFDRERDAEEAARLGIVGIDMVVCNLYPFERARDEGAPLDRLVEQIDIGGPTMIRAAAKNFRWVATLVDPSQYDAVAEELGREDGQLSGETRYRLMRDAFHHTADYDAAISVAMDGTAGAISLRLAFDGGSLLRYGENPHQSATLLKERKSAGGLAELTLLGGKALSYNNLTDLQAALDAVRDLPPFGCAVVKHQNPCGLAVASSPGEALEAAWWGDPVSAFGSVIAFNTPVTAADLAWLTLDAPKKRDRKFVEIVAAPAFDDAAVTLLRNNENLRIVVIDPATTGQKKTIKLLTGAALLQDEDLELKRELRLATETAAGEIDEELVAFGLVAVRQVKSNAIIIVRRRSDGALQLVGMGAGQPNRVIAVGLATDKARENLGREGDAAYVAEEMGRAWLISDAFFPFPDNIDLAAASGIRQIVQPGGSIKDRKVVRRCDELGVAMLMTGTRHFRH